MKTNKKITRSDVERVARLARLRLDEAEKDKFRRQLDEILLYMEKLDKLDTEGVEPLAHILPLRNVLRKDEVKPGLERDEVLKNAPAHRQGLFQVPPVLE